MATGESYGGHEAAVKKMAAGAGNGAAKKTVAVGDVSGGSHDPQRKHPPKGK